MPEQFLAIAAHYAAGRFAAVVAAQAQVNEVIEVLLRQNAPAATKQILCWQSLIESPTCAPLRAQQADMCRRLERTIISSMLVR